MSDEDGLNEMLVEVQKVFTAVYQRAYEAGGIDMRNNILKAANAPMAFKSGSGVVSSVRGSFITGYAPVAQPKVKAGVRARRGLTGEFIREALTRNPGQTPAQLEKLARALEPEILGKSIGNTLRRFDGIQYERAPDGRGWFLKGQQQSAGESDKTAPADHFNFETEGR